MLVTDCHLQTTASFSVLKRHLCSSEYWTCTVPNNCVFRFLKGLFRRIGKLGFGSHVPRLYRMSCSPKNGTGVPFGPETTITRRYYHYIGRIMLWTKEGLFPSQ